MNVTASRRTGRVVALRSIKLMADYGCFPLWEASSGVQANVDPATLPISASLRADLLAWARDVDASLDEDDPANSGFGALEQERALRAAGIHLAARLRTELGPGFDIVVRV